MEAKTVKKRKLTLKQKGFVRDYLDLKNGTQAALKNYDTKSPEVAKVIASQNLTKEPIQEAIINYADRFDDKEIEKIHQALLRKKEIVILGWGKGQSKIEHTGQPHSDAVKALDMIYKIKSTYAAEKSVVLNVNVEELRATIQQNLADFRTNGKGESILPEPPEAV